MKLSWRPVSEDDVEWEEGSMSREGKLGQALKEIDDLKEKIDSLREEIKNLGASPTEISKEEVCRIINEYMHDAMLFIGGTREGDLEFSVGIHAIDNTTLDGLLGDLVEDHFEGGDFEDGHPNLANAWIALHDKLGALIKKFISEGRAA